MPEAPPLTRDLALHIEEITARAALAGTPEIAQFGQTIVGKANGGRPRNWVFCFGNDDLHHLDDILAFYAIDKLQPRFALSPLRFSPEVATALAAMGFRQQAFEQAVLYGSPDVTPTPLPAGLTIEHVTWDSVEEWVRTTADGFEWPSEWREAAMQDARDSFTPDSWRFLARYEGEAAGVASFTVGDDGVAGLGGGAVIPKFRRKGCQLALIHHRLFVAHELGAALVLGGANYNSTSFRNQQRAGLRLAYIESEWGL